MIGWLMNGVLERMVLAQIEVWTQHMPRKNQKYVISLSYIPSVGAKTRTLKPSTYTTGLRAVGSWFNYSVQWDLSDEKCTEGSFPCSKANQLVISHSVSKFCVLLRMVEWSEHLQLKFIFKSSVCIFQKYSCLVICMSLLYKVIWVNY